MKTRLSRQLLDNYLVYPQSSVRPAGEISVDLFVSGWSLLGDGVPVCVTPGGE